MTAAFLSDIWYVRFVFSFSFLFLCLVNTLLSNRTVVVSKLMAAPSLPYTLHAQMYCLQETFLNLSYSITLSYMSIYRLDRQDSRDSGLLMAINSSLPPFKLHLPPCSAPGLEALGVSVFWGPNLDFSYQYLLA